MSKPVQPQISDDVASNLALLDQFCRRTSFHDMEIVSIKRLSGRVIIVVGRYILILMGVTRYDPKLEELPTKWLYDVIDKENDSHVLKVEAEFGTFSVAFRNLRLMREDDYAVLIPQLDK